MVLGLLYGFLVAIAFLETGIATMGAGFHAGLLRSVSHPISGLSAGILTTVLVQSSSVTTAMIVGMVGAGILPLPLAVPMVMGANIGTTVTNTLASLGSIKRSEEFQRAFGAATVHDFFNIMAVLLLLPLELATGLLSNTAGWLTEVLRGADFDPAQPGRSPIRIAVRTPVEFITGLFPATPVTGVLLLGLGLGMIFIFLASITRNMRRLVAGSIERAMNRLISRGGGAVGIVVGIGMTVAVQSSTITTSILVPLVAAGVLTLRNAYPITLGANVGTTITALIASLAVVRPEGLTIALVHTLFNGAALLAIFPVRHIRLVPVWLAERIAELAVRRRATVFAYTAGLFILLPVLGVFLFR